MPEQESSMNCESCLTFCGSLSLPLCVPLYLPSITNQEVVSWTWERITLLVSMPVSGLCFPAWLWLWSWPSMPYRSARRRKKRSSTHKLIPNAEGVIPETDIKKADSLDSWHGWHLRKRKTKGRERWKWLKFYNCEFVVHLSYHSGRPQLWWSTWLYKRPLVWEAMKAALWLSHEKNPEDWSCSCQRLLHFSHQRRARGGEWTTQLKEGKAGLAEKKLLQREKEWAWSKCHIVRWEKKEGIVFICFGSWT